MEKEKKLSKMVFKDYYDTLSDTDKENLRNLIIAESGISYTTFYYKLRNNSFKPLEEKLINRIIAKEISPKIIGVNHVMLDYNENNITNEQYREISRILSKKQ